ncbi:MAG: carbon-nitrogen hydrolase family protein [Phycisphaera sp.]|nr:carbon-nitrogen hydrolase family protein [Phycisphaera sp.]
MTTRIALVAEVYPEDDQSLVDDMKQAADAGARIVVLPECPAQAWAPGRSTPRPADAEEAGGPRESRQSEAARMSGVALLGGGIERCADGRRRNAAVLWDAEGVERLRYHKMHIPDEPGFREAAHYEPGLDRPRVVEVEGLRVGAQICSDNQRPEGAMMLAAQGCDCILNPRATERGLLDRWKTIWRANAMVTGCWVVSANRPRPEPGTPLGGPGVAVSPEGEICLESDSKMSFVDVDPARVTSARAVYPAYLAIPGTTYAAAWQGIPGRDANSMSD